VGHLGLVRAGLLSAITSLALVLAQTDAHAALPDASCAGPLNSYIGLNDTFREAQSFTPQHTGSVVSASVVINKTDAGGDFLIQILPDQGGFSQLPINGALGSGTIPDASIPMGTSTQTATLSAPVVAYRSYAVVVSRPGGALSNLGMRDDDPCPGRESFSPEPNGEWFEGDPDFDLIFDLSVEPTNRFFIHSVYQRKITVLLPSVGSLTAREARPVNRRTRKTRPKLVKGAQVSPRDMVLGGYATLRMQLTRFGSVLLKEKPRLKAQVLVTYTPLGGQPNTMQVPVPLRVPPR
jgi:hypothetical protein